MLSKNVFEAGIKELRANFGLNPDIETKLSWFKHLQCLSDTDFCSGVFLMVENEEKIYPSDNVQLKIKKWAQEAKNRLRIEREKQEHLLEYKQIRLLAVSQQLELEKSAQERTKQIIAKMNLKFIGA